jgi:hypothetical protein
LPLRLGAAPRVHHGDTKTVGILLEAGRKTTYENISFAVVALWAKLARVCGTRCFCWS